MDTIYPPTQVETEIFRLKKELATISLSGLTGKDRSDISELRSFVLLVHDDTEELLLNIITKKLFTTAHARGRGNYPVFAKLMGKVLRQDTFAKLATIAYEIKALDKDLFEDLTELRKLRVIFAHLRDKRYLYFKDEEEQLRVYKLLWKIVREVKSLDFSFRGLTS